MPGRPPKVKRTRGGRNPFSSNGSGRYKITVEPPLALLARAGVAVIVTTAPPPRPVVEVSQRRLELRMVPVADFQRPAARVLRVYVVSVMSAPAGTGQSSEQEGDDALAVAR